MRLSSQATVLLAVILRDLLPRFVHAVRPVEEGSVGIEQSHIVADKAAPQGALVETLGAATIDATSVKAHASKAGKTDMHADTISKHALKPNPRARKLIEMIPGGEDIIDGMKAAFKTIGGKQGEQCPASGEFKRFGCGFEEDDGQLLCQCPWSAFYCDEPNLSNFLAEASASPERAMAVLLGHCILPQWFIAAAVIAAIVVAGILALCVAMCCRKKNDPSRSQ
eukprot:gnl/TRDRNA2_/TRDRNA2_182719_c0_seq1.p1 gnl/TRDRNA2_/TRDRNA2_182719_c0~~gnl/TRDRNA2_/TRDRNA2_182719_c0_seq1.p1  ORF type:complete len:224 (-),score=26.09 gnl/TRDRNA2_/TRDRNA2_182719_c0_seq1:174-845(-)